MGLNHIVHMRVKVGRGDDGAMSKIWPSHQFPYLKNNTNVIYSRSLANCRSVPILYLFFTRIIAKTAFT